MATRAIEKQKRPASLGENGGPSLSTQHGLEAMFFNNTSPRMGDKQQQLREVEDRLAEQVSAIQINAELLITECGFDVHLCHGIRANGGCSCPRGRKCPDIGKHPRGKEWQRRSNQRPCRD